ncbi:MAG: SDR family oxidoreductase [Hyphomicrobiaceae bacterium]
MQRSNWGGRDGEPAPPEAASGPVAPGGYRSVFRAGLFAGRVAIVTGGGSGIGRCTAHELAALGARIAIVGRTQAKLERVVGELRQDGLEAVCHVCDIRDEARVREVVAAVIAQFGRIDHLVNNAGGQFAAPLERISAKGFDAVVRTNLLGGFLMARECYTQWLHAHGGSIVNIVADMWHGMPGMGHSGAARAGMVNFTETAALEWAGANVRVNAVAPGWIASEGMDRYPPERAAYIRNRKNLSPMGRVGTESEVSAAIVFLLSEAAGFISGTTLRVDGAVPNARPFVPLPRPEQPLAGFNGFHRSQLPKVLENE